MTAARYSTTGLRSAILLTAGAALIALPLALGLEAAAVATGVGIGVVMVALALAGTEAGGRGTLPISAQAVYDRGIALGLVAVAIVFGVAGDLGAAVIFAGAGLTALIVTSITRYTAHPA